MCTVTIINRLFGNGGKLPPDSSSFQRRPNQTEPIILPYCPQTSQPGSEMPHTFEHEATLLDFMAAGPASAPPHQDKPEEVQEVQGVADT